MLSPSRSAFSAPPATPHVHWGGIRSNIVAKPGEAVKGFSYKRETLGDDHYPSLHNGDYVVQIIAMKI